MAFNLPIICACFSFPMFAITNNCPSILKRILTASIWGSIWTSDALFSIASFIILSTKSVTDSVSSRFSITVVETSSNLVKYSSILVSKAIYGSITKPLFKTNIFTLFILSWLFAISAKAIFIFPDSISNGIAL